METTDTEINLQSRAYFVEQGRSIARLHENLNHGLMSYYFKRTISIILEIIFYLLFIGGIVFALLLPVELAASIPIEQNMALNVGLEIEEVKEMILAAKLIIIVCSLPLLAFALLLGRNRRKSKMLRNAFEETSKMKEAFDKALTSLKI